eukprot:gnl/TRDRNA2_/TRDRNA2_185654_c0_seq1.p1 gnl/TRDRNA2_/TRDRNA2_185654_c0~~gnl/TRDRNA2_/TRDRNA2_185654_c0_seq1.p1  ORF type:complete len:422 (+),score=26.29 gnl/TRDRNA2_/TRDRNA2_185654_c0_seq1:52-1317(+)
MLTMIANVHWMLAFVCVAASGHSDEGKGDACLHASDATCTTLSAMTGNDETSVLLQSHAHAANLARITGKAKSTETMKISEASKARQSLNDPIAIQRSIPYRTSELKTWYGLPRQGHGNVGLTAFQGEGQTVAIVDCGLNEQAIADLAPSLVKYLDFNPNRLHVDGRPIEYQSHAAKSIVYGFWDGRPLPAPVGATPEAIAPKARSIVLRFAPELYICNMTTEGNVTMYNQSYIQDWVRGLALSLEWILENAAFHNITTVQLSALDGLENDGPSYYIENYPELYGRISESLSRLHRMGLWVSAPAGNSGSVFGKILWPASDPQVTAIGCSCDGAPSQHRSQKVALLMPISGQACVTSRCNIYAAALSMLVRESLMQQCGMKQVNASHILAAMQHGAVLINDTTAHGNLLIAKPSEISPLCM